MAGILDVTSGKIAGDTRTGSTSSTASETDATKKTASSGYDKEMFLKLLVAEMQYQDPMNPSDNTEYVAQFAQFSQVEAIQAMSSKMSNLQANALVGNYVIIKDGENYISGRVDYLQQEGSKIKLSIEDKLYDIDNLDSVYDDNYYGAVSAAQHVNELVGALPGVDSLSISDESKVSSVRTYINSLSNYDLKYVSQDDINKLANIEKRMEELKIIAGNADNNSGD